MITLYGNCYGVMSFVFYVFLLFIDEIQLGVCQTAVLDIAVFSTVFRIVFLLLPQALLRRAIMSLYRALTLRICFAL